MKLKIIITGAKVHDVGFRPWLMGMAMNLSLRGFEVKSWADGDMQAVVALVEGDDQSVLLFYNLAMTEWPPLARVDEVRSEDYSGDVVPMWQAASINTSEQMNKAIPLLIGSTEALGHICKILGSMDKKLDQMLDKQDQALGKMDQTLDKQDQALGKMDQTLDKQDETIEQIQDLRVDMVGRSDIRLARMEKDIRQIVSKMGLR